ncbi:hypothetical protein [Bacillus suaedaesalsae]|uniref:Zinc-finger domain-containing protein n=1 Tax=Bacillus suaedaesalsae TaxID=2810349 RepID=A0ABS2DK28_9BACI|nr:hypothetical protein [Bacillus suaedaesalsae]MBM6618849.1 hypothetical protein [Bacillus suaedaesalsae]
MRHVQEDVLISYSIGDLPFSKMEELELHLENCEVCNKKYEELIELTAEWDEPSMIPSEDFVHHVMEHIPSEMKQQKGLQSRHIWTNYLLSAAATFLFVNAGLFTEFKTISYQFIYGVGQFSDQLETMTTTSLDLLQGLNVDYILQLWNKE